MIKEKNNINFCKRQNIEIITGVSSHCFPMHSHECFCIGIITNGKVICKFDDCKVVLGQNNVYFIPPHIEHTILSIDNKPYSYQVICIRNFIQSKNINYSYKKLVFLESQIGEELLEKCQDYYNSDDCYNIYMEIIQFIKSNESDSNILKANQNIEVVSISVSYIREHLNEAFCLQKLCDLTNISKFHLIRIFKQQIGVAPNQFYIQEKIKKIKQGLLLKQVPVDLTYDLNFTDQSHLCNTFKKHVGLTPTQFQKSYTSK